MALSRSSVGMRVLIEPGSYRCQNMGDVAMLVMAVRRLRGLWPDAELHVITNDPAALAHHCPGTHPVPSELRARLLPGERTSPALGTAAAGLRLAVRGRDPRPLWQFGELLRQVNLVLVAGQGSLSDATVGHALYVLGTLALAQRRGIPSAMLGQGIGPLNDAGLEARARAVLPQVGLIALREAHRGAALLDRLGVPADRVIETGDDAVELAYEARPATLGSAIGVNLRVSGNAAVTPEVIGRLGPVLQRCARTLGADLLPVPIARGEACDSASIRALLAGYADSDGGADLDSPAAVIGQVGRCRVVVTGAYHAAVFALAQGRPVVALLESPYYAQKFEGLRAQFGAGCEIVRLDSADLTDRLPGAVERGWAAAPALQPALCEVAARQVQAGQEAARRLLTLVHGAPSAAPVGGDIA